MKYSIEQLKEIADEREQWVLFAHNKDLHGSAKECELTAYLAQYIIDHYPKEESGDVL